MKILQTGRSMIEMLGVLAIIGVLSIGGLLGYRRAVNNHQANQILDDANRLAFVILESNQAFQTNDFMEEDLIDSVPYTGTYNLDAFMAAGGQFGIVVTKVPRGVCESLVPKASIEYKVRVMPGSEERYSVSQMSNIGTIYDSFHKDICNDTNDVVLYFGDTSAQCNNPDEGETHVKCLSNAECCGGAFCWYPNNSDYSAAGVGRCEKLTDTNFPAETATMSDGRTWTRSWHSMNWWSAQNWCSAQGLKPATRTDIGCGNVGIPDITVPTPTYCMESSVFNAIHDKWEKGYYHWLDDYGNSAHAYTIGIANKLVTLGRRSDNTRYALCH